MDEWGLSHMVSEPWLTKSTHGPKSRGKSFGTTLWHHVQRYCCLGVLFAHAQDKFLFVDDLKANHKSSAKATTLTNRLEGMFSDVGLHWGIRKCAAIHIIE